MNAAPAPISGPAHGLVERLHRVLPRGGGLPHEEWRRRHRVLVGFLWINAVILSLFSVIAGGYEDVLHDAGHAVTLLPFAALASWSFLGQKLRSVFVSLGLLSAAALLVHLTGGLIEAHFYFFVVIVILTVYEDWVPFLLAVAFVLGHHGIAGTIAPHEVYNHPDAWANPWLWAGIHAFFVALAGLAGVIAWRLNENVRERMLATQLESLRASETDSLTQLPNRRKAMADLEAAFDEPARGCVLILLDLDGFKAYNDTFGHPAGDTLLRRLGQRLATAVGEQATAYRLGGDEFCILAPGSRTERERLEAAAVEALYEHGEAFSITVSHGSVLTPEEANSPSEAMQTADTRMYSRKQRSRPSALSQSRDVLIKTLEERYPDVNGHSSKVGALVEQVARELGVAEESALPMRYAAELHDIGKVAIPDAIIHKPDTLNEEEWEFIRRHTVIGQRIVEAAPVLGSVGKLIRSSHEHWNGGGYPDGLAGEEIPLGARIICVCDAFDAMTSRRSYRGARSQEAATAEVRRCAGTQFDPMVVNALEAVLRTSGDAQRQDPARIVVV